MRRASARTLGRGVAATAWSAVWLGTYRLHGPSFDSGAVGYLRLALALAIGFAIPRPWTPLLALVVPLAAIGLPSDDEVVAGVMVGTAVTAALILTGVVAGVVVRKGGRTAKGDGS